MSDEKKSDRTPEEIEATVRSLDSETTLNEQKCRQGDAETRKLEAETRKLKAEARQAQAEADVAAIKRDEAVRKERDTLAEARFQHIYYFTSDVTASSARECASKLGTWSRQDPGCDIEIIFTSPGGSVIDGMYLFDVIQDLRRSGHKVVTGTYGMAASMAGILLQAGDERWMSQQSWLLIHKASFGAMGSMDDVEDRVKWVKRIEKRIVDIFVSRSDGKLSASKIRRNWDRRDWWLTAEQALDLGLIDEIRGGLIEMEADSDT